MRWGCRRRPARMSRRRASFRRGCPEYPPSTSVYCGAQQGAVWLEKAGWFLTEVLWGERIGLLRRNDRRFTIYFAQLPLAQFDGAQLRIVPLPDNRGFDRMSSSVRDVPGLKCQQSLRPFTPPRPATAFALGSRLFRLVTGSRRLATECYNPHAFLEGCPCVEHR